MAAALDEGRAVAKITDFGLAVQMQAGDPTAHVSNVRQGTLLISNGSEQNACASATYVAARCALFLPNTPGPLA